MTSVKNPYSVNFVIILLLEYCYFYNGLIFVFASNFFFILSVFAYKIIFLKLSEASIFQYIHFYFKACIFPKCYTL